eukprot:6466705-Amphidinium_carterae.1
MTSGCKVTNDPPHGRPRVLDDILISPELTPFLDRFAISQVGGFSTHRLVRVDLNLSHDLSTLGGLKFDAPLTSHDVGECATKDGYTPDEWWRDRMDEYMGKDPQTIYTARPESLNVWLGIAGDRSAGKCVRGAMTCHR